jgi:hypothetical protein
VAEEAQAIDRNAIPIDLSAAADRPNFDLEDPAIKIQQLHFSGEDDWGIIRIQEKEVYQQHKAQFVCFRN